MEGQHADKHRERCGREVEMMTNNIRQVNIARGLIVRPKNFLHELMRGNATGMPVLITEYCAAGNLRQQLNNIRNSSGMLESDVRNIMQAMKNALSYLHSLSKVHRNIKPENIVIQLTNDGQRIYKVKRMHVQHHNLSISFVLISKYNVYIVANGFGLLYT